MKNTVYLKFLWKNRKLELLKSEYLNNNKLYLWLIDPKDWDYFSDITINLSEYSDPIYKDYNFIDPEFIELCFSYIWDCKNRLEKNLNIKWFYNLWNYYYFTF